MANGGVLAGVTGSDRSQGQRGGVNFAYVIATQILTKADSEITAL